MEYVEGDKVNRPDQFGEIAAGKSYCTEQYLFPWQVWPPDGRRESTQHKQPEGDVSHSNQAKGQIAAPFLAEVTG